METKNINVNPESGSEKKAGNGKAKKVAGESAKFAAAAGLGVAGTMAAAAMTSPSDEEVEEVVEETDAEAVDNEEAPVNPNDVRLDHDHNEYHIHNHYDAPDHSDDHDTVDPVTEENENEEHEAPAEHEENEDEIAAVNIDEPEPQIDIIDEDHVTIDSEPDVADNLNIDGLPNVDPIDDIDPDPELACGDDMMDDIIA